VKRNGLEVIVCTKLAKDIFQWRAFGNTRVNIRVSQKEANILVSGVTAEKFYTPRVFQLKPAFEIKPTAAISYAKYKNLLPSEANLPV
jgi:hypothetical protein